MAEFPALQLWTDAYLGDTTHLTCMEHGAYLLLLMTAWRTRDTCLPDDDALLARYARCTRGQWGRIRPILEPFYTIKNGQWIQSRLIDEAKAVRLRKEKAAIGGHAKALKTKGRHAANAETSNAHAVLNECLTTATATIEPIDKSIGSSAAKSGRLPKGFVVPPEWLEWAIEERHWTPKDAFIEAANFTDFWHSKSGKDATKADWPATWRVWVRNSRRLGSTGGTVQFGQLSVPC